MSTCPNVSQSFHCNFKKKRVRISRINCMQFYSVSKKIDVEAFFFVVQKNSLNRIKKPYLSIREKQAFLIPIIPTRWCSVAWR